MSSSGPIRVLAVALAVSVGGNVWLRRRLNHGLLALVRLV